MMSEKHAILALKIIIPVFVALLSACVFATKIPETKFITDSVVNLEDSQDKVMKFTGGIMATSIAISALPDDFATPLADALADMDKYFVFIMIVIFVERLIVLEGTKLAFLYVIPIACGLYILAVLIKKEILFKLACKVAIFGIALIFVVPCSIHFSNVVAADYLAYVDETIAETNDGADVINRIISSGEEGSNLLDKISNAFHMAMEGMPDLVEYFKTILQKCMNSIAILIVTSFVMPLVTLWFFKWLLGELFRIQIPETINSLIGKKSHDAVRAGEKKL